MVDATGIEPVTPRCQRSTPHPPQFRAVSVRTDPFRFNLGSPISWAKHGRVPRFRFCLGQKWTSDWDEEKVRFSARTGHSFHQRANEQGCTKKSIWWFPTTLS